MMPQRGFDAFFCTVTLLCPIHIMVTEGTPLERRLYMNNCLCNLFDNNCTWIIIIALIILLFCSCCNG